MEVLISLSSSKAAGHFDKWTRIRGGDFFSRHIPPLFLHVLYDDVIRMEGDIVTVARSLFLFAFSLFCAN